MTVGSLRVLGPSTPVRSLPSWLPPQLRELFEQHGEGTLAGQVRLVAPGTEAHEDLERRFEGALQAQREQLGWLLVQSARAGVTVLGDLRVSLGFLIHLRPEDGSDRSLQGLWLCHRSGGVHPVGADLSDLLGALLEGMVYDIEARTVGNEWALGHKGARSSKEAPAEFVTKARELFELTATYDTRQDDAVDALRDALASGDEERIEAALSATLERETPGYGLAAAERLAQDAGPAGASVLETVALIRRRNPALAWFAALAARDTKTKLRERLRELGFRGESLPDRAMVAYAGALPPADVLACLEDAVANVEASLPPTASAFRSALAACSPEDAWALTAMLACERRYQGLGSPELSWLPLARWWSPVPKFDSAKLAFEGAAWSKVGPLERLWPAAVALAFYKGTPNRIPAIWPSVALRVASSIRAEPLLSALDAYLARPSGFTADSACIAAQMRTGLRAMTPEDVHGVADLLGTRPAPPKTYSGGHDEATLSPGLMELLKHSADLDAALLLLAKNATRDSYIALEAARRRGASQASLTLLRALWGEPKRHPTDIAYKAGVLAASWGDAEAKRALPDLEKKHMAEQKRLERM